MALSAAPVFIGKITIGSTNNKIYWNESTAGDQSATLTSGTFFPDTICADIATQMNAASANTYSCSFSPTTGFYTINRDAGSETFRLDLRTSKTFNAWIGGNTDTAGNTWSTGNYGPMNLGFKVESALGTLATSVTSVQVAGSIWFASQPAFDDSLQQFDSQTTVESTSLSGESVVYDFTGWETLNTEFPLYGGLRQSRTLSFRLISNDSRTQYLANWWGPYAKSGGSFYYYPQYNDTTVKYIYRLHAESLRVNTFAERLPGYPLFTGNITMVRAGS